MKILVIGDKESTYLWDHFDYDRFKDIDCIISTGDLKSEYLRYLVTITNVPLYYIHGNHDTDYANSPPEGCDNIDGKIIKLGKLRILGIGGSRFYNGGEYQYEEYQMKMRLLKLKPSLIFNRGFDILVTHAPAFGLGDGKDLAHQGFHCFRDLIDNYQPRYHFHGHQHLSYSNSPRIVSHNQTTIINSYEYHLLTID